MHKLTSTTGPKNQENLRNYLTLKNNQVHKVTFGEWVSLKPIPPIRISLYKDVEYISVLLSKEYEGNYFATYFFRNKEKGLLQLHQTIDEVDQYHGFLSVMCLI